MAKLQVGVDIGFLVYRVYSICVTSKIKSFNYIFMKLVYFSNTGKKQKST